MYLKKTLSYNLKRILPVLTIAGASLFGACTKEDEPDLIIDPPKKEIPKDTTETQEQDTIQQPQPEPIDTTIRIINIYFDQNEGAASLYKNNPDGTRDPSDMIKNYVAMSHVDTIYLIPTSTWCNFYEPNITGLRENVLEFNINYSPKIRGKGDFDFMLGKSSTIPEDSLWYIKNGWTINKNLQR